MDALHNDVGLKEVAKSFSGPQLPMESSLLEYVVVQYGSLLLDFFLQSHQPVLQPRNPALVRFLERAAEERVSFETCWRPSFGLLETYIQQGVNDPVALERLALSLAWDLVTTGSSGSWSSSSTPLNALLIGDRILPPAEHITVDADSSSLDVILDSAAGRQSFHFNRPQEAGATDGTERSSCHK